MQLRPGRDRHGRNAGVLRLRASLSNATNAGSGIEPYVHFLNRDLRFHFKVGSGRSTPRSRKVPIPPLSLRGHSYHQRQALCSWECTLARKPRCNPRWFDSVSERRWAG